MPLIGKKKTVIFMWYLQVIILILFMDLHYFLVNVFKSFKPGGLNKEGTRYTHTHTLKKKKIIFPENV